MIALVYFFSSAAMCRKFQGVTFVCRGGKGPHQIKEAAN
jgi:hypothetical protein